MESIILQTAARIIVPLQIFLSLIVLLRGHNEPGGGFIGGLLAAAAIILYGFAFDLPSAQKLLRFPPKFFIGMGLLFAAFSGIPPMLEGKPFLTGLWSNLAIPTIIVGKVKLGTPVFFDIGVFFVVIGIATIMVFSFAEERREK
ncbi:MAG: Na+/H+ antiporter subunit B [Chthoniobacterales bacterium]